jgi:hypothetical protein
MRHLLEQRRNVVTDKAKRGQKIFFLWACRLRGRNLSVLPSQNSLSRRWKVFWYIGERILDMNLNSYFFPVFALQVLFYFSVFLACFVLLKVNLRQKFRNNLVFCSSKEVTPVPHTTCTGTPSGSPTPLQTADVSINLSLQKKTRSCTGQMKLHAASLVHCRHFTLVSVFLIYNIIYFSI